MITEMLHLLCHVDAAERSHVTVSVLAEHFAHGAGRRLAGQTVDVDLLLFVFFTHELLLLILLLRLHVNKPAKDEDISCSV